jgi:hypothetical protein
MSQYGEVRGFVRRHQSNGRIHTNRVTGACIVNDVSNIHRLIRAAEQKRLQALLLYCTLHSVAKPMRPRTGSGYTLSSMDIGPQSTLHCYSDQENSIVAKLSKLKGFFLCGLRGAGAKIQGCFFWDVKGTYTTLLGQLL